MNEITTAGISLKYCVETTAGTKPTSGYTTIPGVKSIPAFNSEPELLECTDLSDPEYKRYVSGLKDLGGAIGITVNDTTDFATAWDALVTAAETAKAAGKACWFEYAIPNRESFYFSGEPSPRGFGGAEVNSVLESTAYIVPNTVAGFATASA